MANYAVVRNGAVENMVVWDGETEFSIDGATLVLADSNARIGGTYDGAFHYVEPPVPELTAEQLAHDAARQSALNKLSALGLGSEEIIALLRG